MAFEESNRLRSIIFFILICFIIIIGFSVTFQSFNIKNNTLAMDWKTFWPSIQGGKLIYIPLDGLRFPPWSMIPFIPLGYFSLKASWGVLAGISVIISILSVPTSKTKLIYWLSIILFVLSYPSLRNLADGNMEAIVVGGILLVLVGFRIKNPYVLTLGALIGTIKLQEVTLLFLGIGILIIQKWDLAKWLKAGILFSLIVGLSLLWRGKEWFVALFGPNYAKYTSSIIDVSITGALSRLGFESLYLSLILILFVSISSLYIFLTNTTHINRLKIGFLVAASILVAPYAAGNSIFTVLSFGIIPYFQMNKIIGGFLIFLVNLPFFLNQELIYNYSSYYWTIFLFFCWVLFGFTLLHKNNEFNSNSSEGKSSMEIEQIY